MSNRDFKSEAEKERNIMLKKLESYFRRIRKNQDHYIFTTPKPREGSK